MTLQVYQLYAFVVVRYVSKDGESYWRSSFWSYVVVPYDARIGSK